MGCCASKQPYRLPALPSEPGNLLGAEAEPCKPPLSRAPTLLTSRALGQLKVPRSWEDHLKNVGTELQPLLQDHAFVATCCDLDCSGNLDEHELKQALACFGLKPPQQQVTELMGSRARLDPETFRLVALDLDRNLPQERRCPPTVPHSLRGMALGQLKHLQAIFVASGWLEKRCQQHNEEHAEAIQQGRAFQQGPNLYAMDSHVVTPLTKPGECEARVQLGESKFIPRPRHQSSFSELVNPSGCRVHFFVSHFWGHLFQKTMQALDAWAKLHFKGLVQFADAVVYWICLFALNQHQVAEEVGELPMQGPFNAALAQAQGGAVMIMDEKAEPFKRIWCLFEVHRLQEMNRPLELITETGAFRNVLQNAKGSAEEAAAQELLYCAASTLWNVKAFEARSSSELDKQRILCSICDPHLRNLPSQKLVEAGFGPSAFNEFDNKIHSLLSSHLLQAFLETGDVIRAFECFTHGARFTSVQLAKFLETAGPQMGDQEKMVPMVLAKLLRETAHHGHAPETRALIEANADLDTSAGDGITALMFAIMGANTEVVYALVQARANVEAVANVDGMTPLLHAAVTGSSDIIRVLLEAGASTAVPNGAGLTPMLMAADRGHASALALLCQHRADVHSTDRSLRTPLSTAAGLGHEEAARVLIGQRADMERRDKDGFTALTYAAAFGQVTVVDVLLESKAQISALNKDNRSGLFLSSAQGHEAVVQHLLLARADTRKAQNGGDCLLAAAENGHASTAELLIRAGMRVNAVDKGGAAPIHMACFNGHSEVVELLFRSGADATQKILEVGVTPLLAAVAPGHEEASRIVLRACPSSVGDIDAKGRTGLHIAALHHDHDRIIKLLLEAQADVNATDPNGITALMLATIEGHEAPVASLLDAGAVADARTLNGTTALMGAVAAGSNSIVKMLLPALAKGQMEAADEDGTSALMMASTKGHEAIVASLVECQREGGIQQKDSEGRDSLLLACMAGHAHVAELLLEARANVETRDRRNLTPLQAAALEKSENLVRLLLDHRADANVRGPNRRHALFASAFGDSPAIAKLLLTARAEIDLEDCNGVTPLMLAAEKGHHEMTRLLLESRANVNSRSQNGCSALVAASELGHESVAELLRNAGAEESETATITIRRIGDVPPGLLEFLQNGGAGGASMEMPPELLALLQGIPGPPRGF